MQKSPKQAQHANALKDVYVEGVKNETREGRLIPTIAQQPAVLQASGHINLDTGMRGGVNDNDPSMYIYRGGETQQFHDPSMANPIDGGSGESRMGPLDQQMQQHLPQLRQEFDERERGNNMHRIFGQNPNEIARRGPVTQEEFDKRLKDKYDYRNKPPQHELRDPMTVKHLLG